MPVETVIELRQGTAAEWTSANPTLTAGQPGYETDTGKLKIGDGSTAWTSLGYKGGPTSPFALTVLDDTTAGAVLTTLGLTAAAQTMIALSDVVGIRATAVVTLTDAQIKALGVPTPITLVAAPGAGFIVKPVGVPMVVFDWTANYTNINAAAQLFIRYASGVRVFSRLNEDDGGEVTALLANGGDRSWVPGTDSNIVDVTDFENQALVIALDNSGGGALTGGNAANTLKVHLECRIVAA